MKSRFFLLLFMFFYFSFVSAGLFDDVFAGITGNAIANTKPEDFGENELSMITCTEVKKVIDEDFLAFEIPKSVPFKTEFFNIYIDDEFFISLNLEKSKVKLISCEKFQKPTYNIYVKNKLILDVIGNKDNINPLDFYHENRKNGRLKIKPVGIGRKFKMSFINFGLRIASWFD